MSEQPNNSKSIGDRMREGNHQALKTVAILAGILVYLGMVVYSAVHNWRLLTAGVAPDMVIWAALGVVALEISAVFLPVALHFWTHAPLQRIAAFTFYGLDLALIFLNVVLDYAVVTEAGAMPPWLQLYLFYGAPATPILAGLGWSVLFLLDPSQRERAMVETLRAATRELLSERIAESARNADVTALVDQTAGDMAIDVVKQVLGASAASVAPPNVVIGTTREPSTNGAGRTYPAESETPGNPTIDLEKVKGKK